MTKRKPDALIFDVDGTLFRSESIAKKAYERTVKHLLDQQIRIQMPPVEKYYSCLGMTTEEIWNTLLPNESQEVKDYVDDTLGKMEADELSKGNGELYEGVYETLEALHNRGVQLFTASNGTEDYVKSVVKACRIEKFFDRIYSAGEFNTSSKVDLVRLIINNHEIKHAWMVGDRSSDVEAGKKNGLVVIGCDFANFKKEGELDHADMIITEFNQLLELYEKGIN